MERTRRKSQEVKGHLREFAHDRVGSPATEDLGYLRPMAVADFLSNGSPAAVAELMRGVDAVFLELHGGDRWAFFSTRGFRRVLGKTGLTRTPEWAR